MKSVLLLLMLLLTLHADEVERIEKIVQEITQLRYDHDVCQRELALLKKSAASGISATDQEAFKREMEVLSEKHQRELSKLRTTCELTEKKNRELGSDVKATGEFLDICQEELADARVKLVEIGKTKHQAAPSSIDEANQKVRLLQGELRSTREQHRVQISRMKAEYAALEQNYMLLQKELASYETVKPCTDPNPFPKLLMKEEYRSDANRSEAALPASTQKPADDAGDVAAIFSTDDNTAVSASEFFKARPFRLVKEAAIYEAPDGKVIDTWEARTSFTSGERRGAWVRITGYFVDRQWQPSRDRQLWIKAEDVKMR